MLQILVGLWFLWTLPEPVVKLFMGGHSLATGCLAGAAAVAVVALFTARLRLVWATTCLALLTVTLMVVIRDLVRRALLSPYFSINDLEVVPQYSIFYLFLVTLILGLVIVGVMLKWAAEAGQGEEVAS